MFFVERHEIPIVEISLCFHAGSAYDANKSGIAQLCNALLLQGTQDYSAEQINTRIEECGAQIYTNSDRDMALIAIRSLTKSRYLNNAVHLLSEILHGPAFAEQDFNRLRNLVQMAQQKQNRMPELVARNIFYQTIYPNHPYGKPVLGIPESLVTLTVNDVIEFYQQYYVAKNATINIVGDLTNDQAHKICKLLMKNLSLGKIAKKIPIAKSLSKSVERYVQFPSEQTHIVIGQVMTNYHDPLYLPIVVGNTILGGSHYTSRLFKTIREEKGLAYNITSIVTPLVAKGPFAVILQTKNQTALEALNLVQQVMEKFITLGPTKAELENVKKRIINTFPMTIASNQNISSRLQEISFHKLSQNYLNEYCDKITAITKEQIINAFAQKCLLSKMAIIIVGIR